MVSSLVIQPASSNIQWVIKYMTSFTTPSHHINRVVANNITRPLCTSTPHGDASGSLYS